MKREYRLLKKEDFKKVLDEKKRVSREIVTIFHKKNEFNHIRVGVSVSSKIGNSVVRHKVKRQIVSIVDNLIDKDLKYDFVIIAKSKFLENSYKENYEIFKSYVDNFKRKEKKHE